MPNQPTSFRYPFVLPADVHEGVRNALRITFNGVKDLNDAIRSLKTQVDANKAAVTNVTNVVNAAAGGASPTPTPSPAFGTVNLQPNLTPGAYTLAQSDFAGLIMVQSGIAFALTLNSGLVTPFFTTVYNLGAGTITATPSLGNVNNVASVTVVPDQFAIFFFDGTNWWDVAPLLAKTFVDVPKNWVDSFDSATGIFHASQPQASDLQNGTTGKGAVVLESGPTLHATDGGTGILSILGLPAFLNNAAAVGGGLVIGNLYRTGLDPDTICVVH